tara:strand:- start:1295 stop:1537 length:243 start_codon:yes stop_codon:yes gene_type:complete
MAGGSLWAEQMICKLSSEPIDKVDMEIQLCVAGDILSWRGNYYGVTTYIVTRYCDHEKQITISHGNVSACTYTGKKMEFR